MKKLLIVILAGCLVLDYYISSKLQTSERVQHAQKASPSKAQKIRPVQGLSLIRT